jgi:hypothetical protein
MDAVRLQHHPVGHDSESFDLEAYFVARCSQPLKLPCLSPKPVLAPVIRMWARFIPQPAVSRAT